MTAQDPELSAALGWPGGISDPVLDRTRLLQMVAALRLASQQALEALERARPLRDDYATLEYFEEGKRKHYAAMTALRAALTQQAEPVEPAAWVASKDGRVIYDDASMDDGLLRVSGDFENDEQRVRYAQRIVDKLNAAPPQRKPLTDGEIPAMAEKAWKPSVYYDAVALLGTDGLVALVRAAEKAVWEKNHGQA